MDTIVREISCAGVELGGTNCSIAIGRLETNGNEIVKVEVIEKTTIPTEDPETTVKNIVQWLQGKKFEKFGLASFGPLGLNRNQPDFGYITSTPKPNWGNFPIGPSLAKELNLTHYGFETDVNACAKAQFKFCNPNGIRSLAYITVGTGLGVGLIINGECVHGLVHPEGGHIRVQKRVEDADFPGVCSYHGDCLEGLVTNVSIAKRLNCHISDLPNKSDEDPVWRSVGFYLANLCLNLTLITSVEQIVIGGGVLNRSILYDIIREEFTKLLNLYVQHPKLTDILNYIVEPSFGQNLGVVGAFILE